MKLLFIFICGYSFCVFQQATLNSTDIFEIGYKFMIFFISGLLATLVVKDE